MNIRELRAILDNFVSMGRVTNNSPVIVLGKDEESYNEPLTYYTTRVMVKSGMVYEKPTLCPHCLSHLNVEEEDLVHFWDEHNKKYANPSSVPAIFICQIDDDPNQETNPTYDREDIPF